jgi:hypothetical protein
MERRPKVLLKVLLTFNLVRHTRLNVVKDTYVGKVGCVFSAKHPALIMGCIEFHSPPLISCRTNAFRTFTAC